MKYLIIQLAAIGTAPDKKERLLLIPNVTTLVGTVDTNYIPKSEEFLTISYGEYEANKDNWTEYKAKLIAEKKAQLGGPTVVVYEKG